jgi:hypothetical protein
VQRPLRFIGIRYWADASQGRHPRIDFLAKPIPKIHQNIFSAIVLISKRSMRIFVGNTNSKK